jgi:hypothetical protein
MRGEIIAVSPGWSRPESWMWREPEWPVCVITPLLQCTVGAYCTVADSEF